MLPQFLLLESTVSKDGETAAIPLENGVGKILQITLGITEVTEQSSLEVQIVGSVDGNEWEAKPLAAFPQKFYKGIYTVVLDLTGRPDIGQIKAKYKAARWGHWTTPPEFRCYIFTEVLAA